MSGHNPARQSVKRKNVVKEKFNLFMVMVMEDLLGLGKGSEKLIEVIAMGSLWGLEI